MNPSPGGAATVSDFIRQTSSNIIYGVSVPYENYTWKCVSPDSSDNFANC